MNTRNEIHNKDYENLRSLSFQVLDNKYSSTCLKDIKDAVTVIAVYNILLPQLALFPLSNELMLLLRSRTQNKYITHF